MEIRRVLEYEYHPAAEAEYLGAVKYYSRFGAELGMSFVREIENAVERARLHPELHRRITGEVRRLLTRRFAPSCTRSLRIAFSSGRWPTRVVNRTTGAIAGNLTASASG